MMSGIYVHVVLQMIHMWWNFVTCDARHFKTLE